MVAKEFEVGDCFFLEKKVEERKKVEKATRWGYWWRR